jgi:hypothetical protein
MKMLYIFMLINLLPACDDRPPPCHPEGAEGGTIFGPELPPPRPGGPGDPPDHGDAPEKYNKNEQGEVCLCGPYMQ